MRPGADRRDLTGFDVLPEVLAEVRHVSPTYTFSDTRPQSQGI